MIPRPEYPRPQMRRDEWACLNGEWEFEIDQGDSGLERGLLQRSLSGRIVVPFSPEAPLSGVGNTDFLHAVWYRRQVSIPHDWAGRRVLLHFQAVDYDATVWVDGVEAGRHRGGSTPFSVELAGTGTKTVVVRARDLEGEPKPRGKQSTLLEPHGCVYPRTTGIWQAVWMEPVGTSFLTRPRITPDLATGTVRLEQRVDGPSSGVTVRATLSDGDGVVATAERRADVSMSVLLDLQIPESHRRPWSISDPFLYDLTIELVRGDEVVDRVSSYAGLRSISIDGTRILLNGRPVFQRLVLDQGYWPSGVLTAPTDVELEADIRRSQQAGFNGARMHQKVAEERWLYHADRLGYMVWGEFADWGAGGHGPAEDPWRAPPTTITQWLEAVERDYSHPSVVGWCPLNETAQAIGDRITTLDDTTLGMFLATKAADRTRPVIDASGWSHRIGAADVYDAHDYEQDPAVFKARWDALASGEAPRVYEPEGRRWSVPWRGQPFILSEFGGTWWSRGADDGWGYGTPPVDLEEFYARFEGLCGALLDNPYVAGYCYTQLTDVYQEQNGIYTFEREPKFDVDRLRAIQERAAATEKEG